MRAVDTNVLVHAEIVTSQFHSKARALIVELAEGVLPWAIPWPCVYEFLRVVTHPRVFNPPMPIALALADLSQILRSPTLTLLGETSRHSDVMMALVADSGATGNLLHDAHIAALCIEHGVTELLTGDGDFARFPIKATNPFR
ncbi:MAG TPA: TA system VapC family ribonuclease toxin [Thermoanaerobaculia bacterium]|nr:TA system VapC family ribonuclease toxin [Thermoanaerobaculia bacterium]